LIYSVVVASRRAFTLIELIVVVVIFAILVAILLPVLSSARRSANTRVCGENLASVYEATSLYAGDHDGYVPSASPSGSQGNARGLYIAARPKEWKASLATFGAIEDLFWCPLGPQRDDPPIVLFAQGDPADQPRETNYDLNTIIRGFVSLFAGPDGSLRLNLSAPPSTWPHSPSNTIYLHDVIWPINAEPDSSLVSGHGTTSSRLYLDGHVRVRPVEE